jgi:hypothetical protein
MRNGGSRYPRHGSLEIRKTWRRGAIYLANRAGIAVIGDTLTVAVWLNATAASPSRAEVS